MSNIVKTRLPEDMLQFVQTKENVSGYIRDLIRADMTNEIVPQHSMERASQLTQLYLFFEKQDISNLKFTSTDLTMIEEIEKYVN